MAPKANLSISTTKKENDLDEDYLKQQLDIFVERVGDPDPEMQKTGLDSIRKLACEITQKYAKRKSELVDPDETEDEDENEDLRGLARQIAALYMKHNAEFEAVDILKEVEDLHTVEELVVKENYKKTCLYLTSLAMSRKPELNLHIVWSIYMKFEEYSRALQIALRLDESEYVQKIFTSCTVFRDRQQLCFNIARHGHNFSIDTTSEDDEGYSLQAIIHNNKLHEGYLTLARDLDVMESKSPEDICKAHLTEGRGTAMQNLATTYVNAFVNAGFCQDKLMTLPSDTCRGAGAAAAASLGMIFLWNADPGLAQLNKYLHSRDTHVIAGALLGVGIVNCNVQAPRDPARNTLGYYVDNEDSSVRIGDIMGLGLAYAGKWEPHVRGLLMPLLQHGKASLDVIAFAAISLGLVYVGSCNEAMANAILKALMNLSEPELGNPMARIMPLGLGLLYLGKRKSEKAIAEDLKNLNVKIRKYCATILLSCAYAGTGDVLKVQHFHGQSGEPLEKGEPYQGPAVLGIAMMAMAGELGLEMTISLLEQLLQHGEQKIRIAVPLALGLLCISNPKVNVMDTLSRLCRDRDKEVALAAVISLGLLGAGTNNARIAEMLNELSRSYCGDESFVFCVMIAQGLVYMGKGLMTLSPYHSEQFLLSPTALAGTVIMLHACLDMKAIILGKYHYVLYFLSLAMQPRMLMTVDEDLKPLSVLVRVGQAVNVVGQLGHPKTITGFQTHSTPILLSAGDRAELATEKYIPLSPILEGFVILKLNPDYNKDN